VGDTRRLFFALWPDEAERGALIDATASAVGLCGGRPLPAHNLHVTLAFLGTVERGRLAELTQVARTCAAALAEPSTLSLRLTRLAHWRAQQILCALSAAVPTVAQRLAVALKDGAVAAGGFSPDLKPFQAHVTLARKVARVARLPPMQPVLWSFDAFALVASRTDAAGPIYSVIEFYPLVGAQKSRE
jgi:RNA 2',3'-cyclic 3'-phosphodiesterase